MRYINGFYGFCLNSITQMKIILIPNSLNVSEGRVFFSVEKLPRVPCERPACDFVAGARFPRHNRTADTARSHPRAHAVCAPDNRYKLMSENKVAKQFLLTQVR